MNVSILLKVVDECIDLIAHTLHCDVPKYVCLFLLATSLLLVKTGAMTEKLALQ